MGSSSMQRTTQKPRTACGNFLHLSRQLECRVTFRDSSFTGACNITPADLNLLSSNWFDQLKLADVPLNTICHMVSQPHDTESCTRKLMAQFSSIFQPGLGQYVVSFYMLSPHTLFWLLAKPIRLSIMSNILISSFIRLLTLTTFYMSVGYAHFVSYSSYVCHSFLSDYKC